MARASRVDDASTTWRPIDRLRVGANNALVPAAVTIDRSIDRSINYLPKVESKGVYNLFFRVCGLGPLLKDTSASASAFECRSANVPTEAGMQCPQQPPACVKQTTATRAPFPRSSSIAHPFNRSPSNHRRSTHAAVVPVLSIDRDPRPASHHRSHHMLPLP